MSQADGFRSTPGKPKQMMTSAASAGYALVSAWDTAADCLQKTERLTVIGYSFPGFDRESRRLFLKNFIIPNLFANPAPKLVIIDPDESARKSIKSLFLPAVEKNVAEYSSFEDYCAVLQQSRCR